MDLSFLFIQGLTGLASAAVLFLVASGLSIVFGVTRVLNFAHGSLYMLGAYLAYSLTQYLGAGLIGFWGSLILSAGLVTLIGVHLSLTGRRDYDRVPLFILQPLLLSGMPRKPSKTR